MSHYYVEWRGWVTIHRSGCCLPKCRGKIQGCKGGGGQCPSHVSMNHRMFTTGTPLLSQLFHIQEVWNGISNRVAIASASAQAMVSSEQQLGWVGFGWATLGRGQRFSKKGHNRHKIYKLPKTASRSLEVVGLITWEPRFFYGEPEKLCLHLLKLFLLRVLKYSKEMHF